MPISMESSQPRDRTQVSCIAGRFFTIWATRGTLFKLSEMDYAKTLVLYPSFKLLFIFWSRLNIKDLSIFGKLS